MGIDQVPRLAVTAVTVSVTLAVSACGGGGSLTREQWIEQADAICARTGRETSAAAARMFGGLGDGDTPDPGVLEVFAQDLTPTLQRQIDAIAELDPPAEIEDDVRELLVAAQAAVDSFARSPGDELLEQMAADDGPFAAPDAIARRLGMKECAE